MSVRAVAWALQIVKDLDPTARLVLTYLAEKSNDDGRRAWPSQGTLAKHLGTSERTVRRHLLTLEQRGLIVRGDQTQVEHLPADRRPIVWDLVLPGAGGLYLVPSVPDGGSPMSPGVSPKGTDGGTPVTERGDTDVQAGGHPRPVVDDRPDTECQHGGTPVTERGDTGDHHGGTPVSDKPPMNHPQPPGEPPRASRPLAALPGAPADSVQTPTQAAGIAALRAHRTAAGQR